MIAILLSCVLLLVLKIWKNYQKIVNKVKLPPPAGGCLPIIGHSWMGFVKRERLFEVLVDYVLSTSFQKGEEVVYFSVGAWKLYICMDPDDGNSLLNSCLEKDPAYRFYEPALHQGLISADVPTWKIHRKLLNPTFNQSVLDSYLTQFNKQSRQLVQLLSREVSRGDFDQLPYLQQTVLQIVCATLMGVSVDGDIKIIEEYGRAVETFSSCIEERAKKFYYHSDFLYNLSMLKKKQDAAVKIGHDFTSKVIKHMKDQRKSSGNYSTATSSRRFKSFLELLLEMGEDGTLTDSEIRQEINTFMAAAYDTTYQTLGSTLLTIGSYPEVQKKIVDELQEVFEGSSRNAEKQDMSKLKYLEAVIKETMRLYPVVVVIGRTVDKDLQLKRYTLPAGTRCLLSVYHVGRHHVWGADAASFRPSRWLDGTLPRDVKAYAVFGLGKRSCIGSNFGMMLMKTVLCHVMRHYRISGDVTKLVRNIGVVTTPVSGHHICIEKSYLTV